MKYNLFIFHGIEDLTFLNKALDSVEKIWDKTIVINNTDVVIEPKGYSVLQPPVVFSCTQMSNWMMRISRQNGNDFYLTMHDDACLTNKDAIVNFINNVDKMFNEDEKLGWVGTFYDAVCSFRQKMVDEVGEVDYALPNYGSDCDYFIRIARAGWKCADDPITTPFVEHFGSSKVKSDPYFKHIVDLQDAYKWFYLWNKWGIIQSEWDGTTNTPYVEAFNGKFNPK